jgi:hypothetical protein
MEAAYRGWIPVAATSIARHTPTLEADWPRLNPQKPRGVGCDGLFLSVASLQLLLHQVLKPRLGERRAAGSSEWAAGGGSDRRGIHCLAAEKRSPGHEGGGRKATGCSPRDEGDIRV